MQELYIYIWGWGGGRDGDPFVVCSVTSLQWGRVVSSTWHCSYYNTVPLLYRFVERNNPCIFYFNNYIFSHQLPNFFLFPINQGSCGRVLPTGCAKGIYQRSRQRFVPSGCDKGSCKGLYQMIVPKGCAQGMCQGWALNQFKKFLVTFSHSEHDLRASFLLALQEMGEKLFHTILKIIYRIGYEYISSNL